MSTHTNACWINNANIQLDTLLVFTFFLINLLTRQVNPPTRQPKTFMHSFQPYISVVVPYRNRAHLLGRMLGSVTFPEKEMVELLLVDNGSTDEAPSMATEFARWAEQRWADEKADCRLVVRLESCPNGNACDARNAGLRMARGRWVYFFDSDDQLSPGFFDRLGSELRRRKGIQLLALHTMAVSSDGVPLKRRGRSTDSPANQILTGVLSTQSMVFDRDFLVGIGGWNNRLPKWNDWELGVRTLLARPRMEWVDGCVFHRIYLHADSITGADFSSTFERMLPALDRVRCLLGPSTHEGCGGADGNEKGLFTCASEGLTPRMRLHALRALAAREAILSGQLAHEGSRELSERMWRQADTDARSCGRGYAAWLHFVRWFAAHGGRGAWLLAEPWC